jgi:hypothetical protein
MKVEAAGYDETSIYTHQFRRRHILEDSLPSHLRQNLTPHGVRQVSEICVLIKYCIIRRMAVWRYGSMRY